MRSRRVRWERVGPVRWWVESGGVIVMVDGPLDPADAPSVCASLRAALSGSDLRSVTCRGEGLADPDLATVDLLARLRLTAGRFGHAMRIEDPSRRLRELLVLAGLDELLLPCGSGVETRWQREEREEPFSVEEGVQPDDRPA